MLIRSQLKELKPDTPRVVYLAPWECRVVCTGTHLCVWGHLKSAIHFCLSLSTGVVGIGILIAAVVAEQPTDFLYVQKTLGLLRGCGPVEVVAHVCTYVRIPAIHAYVNEVVVRTSCHSVTSTYVRTSWKDGKRWGVRLMGLPTVRDWWRSSDRRQFRSPSFHDHQLHAAIKDIISSTVHACTL